MSFELEYDWVMYGRFVSNLSEVSSTFADITHQQNKGYGLLFTAGLQLSRQWTVYGFYESWNLDQSDVVQSKNFFFIEPQNYSQSFGLKAGYHF